MFNRVDSFLVGMDRVCDYVPFASTITNLTALFQKYLVLPALSQSDIQANRYYTHLEQKSISRSFLLLIPIIGNVVVATCDIYQKRGSAAAQMASTGQASLDEALQWSDKEFVLGKLRENGLDLWRASEELRADEEVVLAAATQNGLSIKYSKEFGFYTATRIAEAAVKQNGLAIQYVHRLCSTEAGDGGNALYKAYHLNLEAVKQNKDAFEHIHPRWKMTLI